MGALPRVVKTSRRASRAGSNARPLHSRQETNVASTRYERWIAWIVLAGAAILPVLVVPAGIDMFRLPKELLLRAVAIVAAAFAVNGLLLGRMRLDARQRRRLAIPAGIAGAAVLWTAIAAAFSSNRLLSVDGMLYVVALLAIVLIAAHTLRTVTPVVLAGAVLLPAAVNGVIVLLQASGIWNPWTFERTGRSTFNALLGNVNDVGAFLVPGIVLACVMAMATRPLRWLWIAVGAILACALVLTVTLTSIIATVVALTALGAVLAFHTAEKSRWMAILAGVLIVALAASFAYRPLRQRITRITQAAASGEIGDAVSGRLVPFAAAWEMFRTHPFLGVGPGCFRFNYMQYRIALDETHPRLLSVSPAGRANFGQVHNDHLQVLAETGVPGYLILLAGLWSVARISFRRTAGEGDLRARIAATLAFPLVCGLAVNMLGGFPLQLAAPAFTYAILGGACLAWEGDDDPA
jgi:hypothetical protein